jgi:hypothetical protein
MVLSSSIDVLEFAPESTILLSVGPFQESNGHRLLLGCQDHPLLVFFHVESTGGGCPP